MAYLTIQIPLPRKLVFPSPKGSKLQMLFLPLMVARGLWLVHSLLHSRLHLRPLGNWSALFRQQKRKVQRGTQRHHQLILTDLLPEVTSYPQGLAASLMEIRNARLGRPDGPFRPRHSVTGIQRHFVEKGGMCLLRHQSSKMCKVLL